MPFVKFRTAVIPVYVQQLIGAMPNNTNGPIWACAMNVS